MSAERWGRIEDLFHRGLALPAAEREEFLARAAADDAGLRREVRELIALAGESPPDVAGGAAGGSGNYRVVRQIGEGFSAWVFEGVQLSIGRSVAFKVLKSHSEIARFSPDASYDSVARRFELEARVLGSLDHPGIVPIYDVGSDERGRRGFAMRLVQGENFGAVIARTPPGAPAGDLARAVSILADCSETMAYAHARGVVHRDLKPAHLMSGLHGEAYVLDWGLAAVTGVRDESAGRASAALSSAVPLDGTTLAGTALGTPGYMPPEQAVGDRARIGPAADVYALGAILYHLLAGRRPYADPRGDLDPERFLVDLSTSDPAPLSEAAPSAPADLRAVCAMAMARDPARRYAHAGEFAADLRASLEGRPIRARPGGPLDSALRFARRRPAVVGLAVLALLVVASFSAFWRNVPFARADRREAALEAAYSAFAYSDYESARAQFAELDDVPEAASGEILCAILAGDHVAARARLAAEPREGEAVPGARWLRAFLDLESGAGLADHVPPEAVERDAFAAFLRGWTTLRAVPTDDVGSDGPFVLPLGERESRSPRVQRLEDALRDFTNAVDFAVAPRALFHFGRIRAALLLGRGEDARRSAEALLHGWPRSAMARTWAGLAELHDDPARGSETLRSAEALVREGPSAPATRLTLAYVLHSAGARADAERLYRAALAGAEPSAAARAHANLALLELEDGRAEAALASADRAVGFDASLKPAWIHRANALHALGRRSEELAAWRECAARYPTDDALAATLCAVLLEAARAALDSGDELGARALHAEALERARRDSARLPADLLGDVYLETSREAFARGDHALGLARLDDWCGRQPAEPRALAELAWRLVCARVDPSATDCPPDGDVARALELATRMLALPGDRDHAQIDTYAAALHANGRSREALEAAGRALELAAVALEAAPDDAARGEIVAAMEEIARHAQAFEAELAPR